MTDDYLPLRMVNQVRYCERRFWYMHVLSEMEVNAAVLEGIMQHERTHDPAAFFRTQDDGAQKWVYRRAWLWSDRLRIAGLGDIVEVQAGQYLPVEYKRGRLGKWDNDQVQLCAQAMCIEERFNVSVPQGAIYYHASRHRQSVVFDKALRILTEQCIARAYTLLAAGRVPMPLSPDQRPRCRECSLLDRCMPDEVWMLTCQPSILPNRTPM